MLRKLMANKRDVGDFSPQSMLATVIRVFKALKQNGDAAGSKAFFLNIFEQLGPQLDSIKTNAAAFVRAVDDGRDEGVLLASHASLRDSLSGTLEKVRSTPYFLNNFVVPWRSLSPEAHQRLTQDTFLSSL